VAVTTNTWLGATAGPLPTAAQQQAFLGIHKTQLLYTGTLGAAQSIAGSGTTNSNGLYIAQSFATGASQTTVGYVLLNMGALTASGSLLAPLTIGLYANSAGAPTGSALVSVTAPAEYVNPSPSLAVFPLPITGLSPSTTYWIVTQAVGNGTYNYQWGKSNQTSGTSTSTNGSTWTAQTYGSLYAVYDQTASGQLTAIWEDAGARWQALYYGTTGEVSALGQYTVAQNSGYQQGYRNLTYSNGLLQGVA
jgi:hypothetical protein